MEEVILTFWCHFYLMNDQKSEPVKTLAVSLFTIREIEKLLVELVKQVSPPKQDLELQVSLLTISPSDHLSTQCIYL